MSITLRWVNRNPAAEGIRVYRSDTAFTADALPTPLATLGPTVTEYVDSTTVRGQLYHYRLGVYQGTDEAVTPRQVIGDILVDGPGKTKPVFGDYQTGFLGFLTAAEMFTTTELKTQLAITAGVVFEENPLWAKMLIDGKVLYAPTRAPLQNISWAELYAAGVVYGTNDNGLQPFPVETPVNQYKTVTKNGLTFKVRLLKGTNDPTVDSTTTDQSEFTRFYQQLIASTTQGVGLGKWSDLGDAQLNVHASMYNGSPKDKYAWVLDYSADPAKRYRRGKSIDYSQISTQSASLAHSDDYYVGYHSNVWMPCLELVV